MLQKLKNRHWKHEWETRINTKNIQEYKNIWFASTMIYKELGNIYEIGEFMKII